MHALTADGGNRDGETSFSSVPVKCIPCSLTSTSEWKAAACIQIQMQELVSCDHWLAGRSPQGECVRACSGGLREIGKVSGSAACNQRREQQVEGQELCVSKGQSV